jgi:hypothetical protein
LAAAVVKPRTIERIAVFPTRLPVIKTFQLASGSAGTAGGTAPHVFVRVTDSQFIDESAVYPDKARIEFEGALHLSSEPGIGVAPDLAALAEFGAG